MNAHLWEPQHPYYCSETNYYSSGDTINRYNSWASFLDEEGDSDPDYNLLFRWDWDRKEKTLTLFWMGQRKGLFRCTIVNAMHADEEPSVREWLTKRWGHLVRLWAPIASEPSSDVQKETKR